MWRERMGSGNFGGGGSVTWEVINSDGESGGGDKKKCKGKDKDPKNGGSFAVFANGSLQFTLPATKGNTVTVLWGPESSVVTGRPSLIAAPKKGGKG
jgi:hypothetical protein